MFAATKASRIFRYGSHVMHAWRLYIHLLCGHDRFLGIISFPVHRIRKRNKSGKPITGSMELANYGAGAGVWALECVYFSSRIGCIDISI
jgi:hypothetical protein